MHWIRKVGRDLSEGRNLEVYLTITISLVLSILGAFSVVESTVIAAVTLATLSLLSISTLSSREQVSSLHRQIETFTVMVEENILGNIRANNFFISERPRHDKEFQSAKSIFIVGATLSRTAREYLGIFEQRLKDGASLKFVIIDPKSDAAKQAALRSYGVRNDEFYHNRIKPTIELLQILASLPDLKGKTELRLLPYMPSFGLVLIDPDESDGKIYVEIYQHKELSPGPVFLLEARKDESWYRYFQHQFGVLWDSARAADANDGYPQGDKPVSSA